MELHVMAISGTYIELPISSFCAEALALEECTLFISHSAATHGFDSPWEEEAPTKRVRGTAIARRGLSLAKMKMKTSNYYKIFIKDRACARQYFTVPYNQYDIIYIYIYNIHCNSV